MAKNKVLHLILIGIYFFSFISGYAQNERTNKIVQLILEKLSVVKDADYSYFTLSPEHLFDIKIANSLEKAYYVVEELRKAGITSRFCFPLNNFNKCWIEVPALNGKFIPVAVSARALPESNRRFFYIFPEKLKLKAKIKWSITITEKVRDLIGNDVKHVRKFEPLNIEMPVAELRCNPLHFSFYVDNNKLFPVYAFSNKYIQSLNSYKFENIQTRFFEKKITELTSSFITIEIPGQPIFKLDGPRLSEQLTFLLLPSIFNQKRFDFSIQMILRLKKDLYLNIERLKAFLKAKVKDTQTINKIVKLGRILKVRESHLIAMAFSNILYITLPQIVNSSEFLVYYFKSLLKKNRLCGNAGILISNNIKLSSPAALTTFYIHTYNCLKLALKIISNIKLPELLKGNEKAYSILNVKAVREIQADYFLKKELVAVLAASNIGIFRNKKMIVLNPFTGAVNNNCIDFKFSFPLINISKSDKDVNLIGYKFVTFLNTKKVRKIIGSLFKNRVLIKKKLLEKDLKIIRKFLKVLSALEKSLADIKPESMYEEIGQLITAFSVPGGFNLIKLELILENLKLYIKNLKDVEKQFSEKL